MCVILKVVSNEDDDWFSKPSMWWNEVDNQRVMGKITLRETPGYNSTKFGDFLRHTLKPRLLALRNEYEEFKSVEYKASERGVGGTNQNEALLDAFVHRGAFVDTQSEWFDLKLAMHCANKLVNHENSKAAADAKRKKDRAKTARTDGYLNEAATRRTNPEQQALRGRVAVTGVEQLEARKKYKESLEPSVSQSEEHQEVFEVSGSSTVDSKKTRYLMDKNKFNPRGRAMEEEDVDEEYSFDAARFRGSSISDSVVSRLDFAMKPRAKPIIPSIPASELAILLAKEASMNPPLLQVLVQKGFGLHAVIEVEFNYFKIMNAENGDEISEEERMGEWYKLQGWLKQRGFKS